jgi:hypothetical protein
VEILTPTPRVVTAVQVVVDITAVEREHRARVLMVAMAHIPHLITVRAAEAAQVR